MAAFAQAKVLQNDGFLNEPIISFNNALLLARKLRDQNAEIQCLMALGILSWDKGDADLSTNYYAEALKIAQEKRFFKEAEICNIAISIHLLFKEAKKFRLNKNYAKAKDRYLSATNLARRINSVNHEVKCLRQMSSIYFYEFDLSRFCLINRYALTLAKKYNIIREEGYCSYNIALYYLRIGFFYESFNLFYRSLEIADKLKDFEDEIDCLNNLGFILCELGNYEYSLEYFKKALALITENNKMAEILNSIGISIKLNAAKKNNIVKYFEANYYYRKALGLAIENKNTFVEAIILNNIGSSYLAQNKINNALFYLKESLKRGKNEISLDYISDTMINIGDIYFDMHKYYEAEHYYKKAIKLLKNEKIPKVSWGAQYGLGRCFEKKNNINLAIYNYKKAIVAIETIDKNISLDIEKANVLKNKYIAYESLIKVLFCELKKDNNNPELINELLLYIEKAKAKSLFELYRKKTKIKYYSDLRKRYNDKEFDKNNRPIFTDETSKSLLDDYNKGINNYLCDTINSNNNQIEGNNSIALNKLYDLRYNLDTQTSIFVYSIGEEISLLAVIQKYGIDYYELPCRDEIEKSIKAYLKLVSSFSNKKYQGKKAAARILKEIFFPILANKLKDIKKIIIIPDGLLFYLPFEALAIENNNDNSGMFVIEKYDVSYSPSLLSIYVLAQKTKIRKNDISCLIIGDPDYLSFRSRSKNQYLNALIKKFESDGLSLNPLPYTKEEALAIKDVINSNRITMYLDHKACEENIKKTNLKNYDIIHFACHGFYDEEAPTRSGLILSINPASKEDGLLQVGEIYDLDLDADLVVLSACQTARGQIARGEGILGLTRTFFYSGAKTVVSTLWNIDDISTVVFMKYFYTYLSEGMGKSEALRSAKIKMINSQYSHPFYWAAFVLNGDYKSRFVVH
jgi:CHAT domain-containing protein/tetratricopeptide (TPR) repeat protein